VLRGAKAVRSGRWGKSLVMVAAALRRVIRLLGIALMLRRLLLVVALSGIWVVALRLVVLVATVGIVGSRHYDYGEGRLNSRGREQVDELGMSR
jgi:hypothetical protein